MREKRIIEWASWVCVLNGDLSLLFKVLYRSVVVVKQVETCTTVIWKSPGAAMCWLEGRQRLPRSAEPWELPLATTFHKVAGRWSLLSMVGVPHSLCRLSNFMSLWSIWQPGAPEGSVQKYYIFSTYFHWLAAFWNARTLILFYEPTTLFTERDFIYIPKSGRANFHYFCMWLSCYSRHLFVEVAHVVGWSCTSCHLRCVFFLNMFNSLHLYYY